MTCGRGNRLASARFRDLGSTSFLVKKFLLVLAALDATSFTFAADAKAPADKAKTDASCDSCCCDDAKPADAKDSKSADAKSDAKKSDAPKPADKK